MSSTFSAPVAPRRLEGYILHQERISSSMWRLAIELEAEIDFAPGQFCMINLFGGAGMPLSRPLSILSSGEGRLELLYKVVGRGTRALAAAFVGTPVRVLTPLGSGFAARSDEHPRLLLAGGVGLPPLWAWRHALGRPGDLCCFGGRDFEDVPWPLLDDAWKVSVDHGTAPSPDRDVFVGTVIDLAENLLPDDTPTHHVLVCGPTALLRAAVVLARRRGWPCQVSVEERMGCGYGVCRGCVTPDATGGWLTSCKDGPVFDAGVLDWDRMGLPAADALAAYDNRISTVCAEPEVKS